MSLNAKHLVETELGMLLGFVYDETELFWNARYDRELQAIDDTENDDLNVWFGVESVEALLIAVKLLCLKSSNSRRKISILDVGAGNGHVTRVLSALDGVGRVVASELSPIGNKLCRRLHIGSEVSADGGVVNSVNSCKVEYLIDDIRHSILEDSSFDCIIDKGTLDTLASANGSKESVQQWTNSVRVFSVVKQFTPVLTTDQQKMKRLLKLNGVLIVQTCNHSEAMLNELLRTGDVDKVFVSLDGVKSISDALQQQQAAPDEDSFPWTMYAFRKVRET